MKSALAGFDCTRTRLINVTVSGTTFGRGWMFTNEDRVQLHPVIPADYVEYDRLVMLICYERLHVCAYSDAYCSVVIDAEVYRHAGRFVQKLYSSSFM